MKFVHVLHINAKEIEILNEALKMYSAHIDNRYNTNNYGTAMSKEHFSSYRCKVRSMATVMEAVKQSPKPIVSEASIFDGDKNGRL